MNNFIKSKSNIELRSLKLVVLALVVAVMCYDISTHIKSAESNSVEWFFMGFFIAIFILGVWLIIMLFPEVTINREGILFKKLFSKKLYTWEEIIGIELSGKKRLYDQRYEVMTITLSDHKTKHIWMENYIYKNNWALHQALTRAKTILDTNKNFNDLNFDNISSSQHWYSKSEILSERFIKYSGNLYFSFFALACYFSLLFILVTFALYIIYSPDTTIKLAMAAFDLLILGIVYITTYNLYYFLLSDQYIVVKNCFRSWFLDVYKIDDLEEVILNDFTVGTGVRIITKNYKMRSYRCYTIKDKTFERFKEDLLRKGIKVRDESNTTLFSQ
jgi:hypothetical protein